MSYTRKPDWLKSRVSVAEAVQMKNMLRAFSLHTVCEGAQCPNMGECFRKRTVTFMILGDVCTRHCRFCAVGTGTPCAPDPEEPAHVAAAAKKLGLLHTVVTSVTRDDLPDGGAAQFAATVRALKIALPESTVEVLVPDFLGSEGSLHTVLAAKPDIVNHNIETVPALYDRVRPDADYGRSLQLLERVKKTQNAPFSKTGLMVGLGETPEQVLAVMDDLVLVGCDMLTIGQYLQPSKTHLPVAEYIHPERFEDYRRAALDKGIRFVASGPLVRSSYNAAEAMREMTSCR